MAQRRLREEQIARRTGERAVPLHCTYQRQMAAFQHGLMSSIHGFLNIYHFYSSMAAASLSPMQALRAESPYSPATAHPRLPARHDHVGSFLRPDYLLEARTQRARGEISPAQLRRVEDRAIREIVRFQESIGMKS